MSEDLVPRNLPEWLHWIKTCPSTNTWAIAHFPPLTYGAVVFTRHQTAGRGQHGRVWHSPVGVLTASFILDLPMAQLSGLSLVIGLAVIHAVEALLPDQQGKFRLKWPNDVMFEGQKLAGILCEATTGRNAGQTRVVAGIGLNRWVDLAQAQLDTEQVGNAVSLHQISSVVPGELVLLERLRHYLMEGAEVLGRTDEPAAGISAFLPELGDRNLLLNRPITFSVSDETFSGHCVGIDTVGRLLLKVSSGEVKAFASGRAIAWD
jgi:BirA family transcriptional regulator, biotin operon repressor / biotin---[acetyl-CoA-carboxylase] ligase